MNSKNFINQEKYRKILVSWLRVDRVVQDSNSQFIMGRAWKWRRNVTHRLSFSRTNEVKIISLWLVYCNFKKYIFETKTISDTKLLEPFLFAMLIYRSLAHYESENWERVSEWEIRISFFFLHFSGHFFDILVTLNSVA